MAQSRSGDLNKADYIKWGWNTLIFLAPALIVFLGSLAEIIPKEASYGVWILFFINVLTDFLRKIIKGK